jgi:hypothetical protein
VSVQFKHRESFALLVYKYCCSYLDVVGVELVARQGVEGAEVLTSREDAVTSAASVPEEKPKERRYTNSLKKQLAQRTATSYGGWTLTSRIISFPKRPHSLIYNGYRGLGVKMKVR